MITRIDYKIILYMHLRDRYVLKKCLIFYIRGSPQIGLEKPSVTVLCSQSLYNWFRHVLPDGVACNDERMYYKKKLLIENMFSNLYVQVLQLQQIPCLVI